MEEKQHFLVQLPEEIKLYILKFLDIIDFTNLSAAIPQLAYITADPQFISTFDMFKEYRFNKAHMYKFVSHDLRCEVITSLNITSVYWISEPDIQGMLHKLKQLKNLYAMDTALTTIPTDMGVCDYMPNLTTLSITISNQYFSRKYLLPNTVTRLYLYIDITESSDRINLNHLKLEELWVVNYEKQHSYLVQGRLPVDNRVIVFKDKTDGDVFKRKCTDLITFYNPSVKYSYLSTVKPNERLFNLYHFNFEGNDMWNSLIAGLPYPLKIARSDANKLILKEETIDSINIQELDLTHHADADFRTFRNVVLPILLSPSMKFVQKLSLSFCICSGMSDDEMCILTQISQNMPLLKELEFWECLRCGRLNIQVYDDQFLPLSEMDNIEALTFHNIPDILSGNFLIRIGQYCKKLRLLRITGTIFSNALNQHTYLFLRRCSSLKDFRWHQFHISINPIFSALNASEIKLERLQLTCSTMEKLDINLLETYLRKNPQLIFFGLVIDSISSNIKKKIKELLKKYLNQPHQVYLISPYFQSDTFRPLLHRTEMVHIDSRVGIIDFFRDFK